MDAAAKQQQVVTIDANGLGASIMRHPVAILGKTGSGKTSTEKKLVEEFVDRGARVCVLDTVKSDWWDITSSADGKRPAYPFKILGGPRAHIEIGQNAGKAIGQLVAEGKLPLTIVDMAYFDREFPAEGTVRLDELYRAFAGHPKARKNQHYQAKLRQLLQSGPYRNVGRGLWERDRGGENATKTDEAIQQ
jgi:DNA helicase HerA-like ATPase